jgi:hypothetical protein
VRLCVLAWNVINIHETRPDSDSKLDQLCECWFAESLGSGSNCACVRVCVRACVRACVRVCVCVRVSKYVKMICDTPLSVIFLLTFTVV